MAVAGLLAGIFSPIIVRFANVHVATRFATVWLRTAGYLQRVTGFTSGPLPFTESTPATRLLGGPIVFPFGFIPGTASFLEGFAYKDSEDLTDGWLSFIGELILSPIVESGLEKSLKALARGDVVTFAGEWAESLQEEVGLADLAAFFRGVEQIGKDFQSLGLPNLHPAPWLLGGGIAVVNYLDALLTDVGGFLGGLVPEEFGGPTGEPPPPDPRARGRTLAEFHAMHGHQWPHAEPPLPTTEEDLRELFRAAGRVMRRVPDLHRIIQELKK